MNIIMMMLFMTILNSFHSCTLNSYLNLEMVEFTLHQLFVACLSQVMKKSKAMGIHIINEVMEHIMTETLYGDSLRLQQVLVDFLLICINFMPTGGQVVVAASLTKDQLGKSVHLANLEISITHDGVGVPETLLNQMFRRDRQESEEGISLLISRKLLKRMNGDVQYLREAGKSSFILIVELAAS
ncbi:hypothetical protein Ahy_A01g002620 [Arachis hypogaea]|uniref:histidine kinase n=1 Tax=Arachis hypogaea TaxID=3818 RepID=A0A445ER04_ARAHY|nr:hypothetical protein Ahy_A01g002620 [Arachis hypogaea]